MLRTPGGDQVFDELSRFHCDCGIVLRRDCIDEADQLVGLLGRGLFIVLDARQRFRFEAEGLAKSTALSRGVCAGIEFPPR